MPRPLSLREPFEGVGVWWLPETPDAQVSGTLKFDVAAGATLALIGTLGDPFKAIQRGMGGDPAYVTIHGVTVGGQQITLLRALQSRSQLNLPGITVESYVAGWVLIGGHFPDGDAALFRDSRAAFDGLDQWLAQQPFRQSMESEPRRLTVVCEPAEERVLGRVDQLAAEVVARMTIHVDDDRLRRFQATAENTLGLRCDQPRSLVWHFEQASHLNKLAALCTGRHLPFTGFRVVGPDREIAPGVHHPQEVDVLVRLIDELPDPGRSQDPPIYSAAELVRDNSAAMATWFEVSSELEPTIDLFFTVLSHPRLHTEVAFLLVIQAAEVHHRLTATAPLMATEDYEAVKAALLAAIPETAPSEMKKKLVSTLGFANEPSLRQRLKRIIKGLEPVFGPDALGFDRSTIKAAVDSRNYYTHYSPELRESALSGLELHKLTRKFVPLLFVLLLSKLDLPPARIREQLRRRREFANV